MSIPPYMSERIAQHYEETGQLENAARQRQSNENASHARQTTRKATQSKRFQDTSTSRKYLYMTAAALGVGTLAVLTYQWKNMLPEFCPSRFKRIRTEEELFQAAKKDGYQVTECATSSLLAQEGIQDQINTILFRQKYCPDALITTEEKLLEAIRKEGEWMLPCADLALSGNQESIDRADQVFKEVSKRLDERKSILALIEQAPNHFLAKADDDIKDDEVVILSAVTKDGLALKHASPRLQRKREIVEAAIKQLPFMLSKVHPDFCGDKDMVLIAVDRDGNALQYATPDLQNDKAVVLRAISQNGIALQYASPMLRKDKAIAIAAVKQNSLALEFVDEKIKDQELVEAAVKKNLKALQYLGKGYRPDKKKILDIINQQGLKIVLQTDLLKYFPEQWKNDEDIISALIQRGAYVLEHAHPDIRKNRVLIHAAIKRHPLELQHVQKEFGEDEEIVFDAVKLDPEALEYAGPLLKANAVFMAKVKPYLDKNDNVGAGLRGEEGIAIVLNN